MPQKYSVTAARAAKIESSTLLVAADAASLENWLNYIGCILVVFVEPLLCSIGCILNVACIIVFFCVSNNSYFRKTSLLTYLVVLSACNALQLLLSLFVLVLPAIEQFVLLRSEELSSRVHGLSSLSVRFGYPLLLTVNYAAIWLLTLICAQRFQAICHPSNPWKKRLACIRNARLIVSLVVAAAVSFNIVRYWEHRFNADTGRVEASEFGRHVMYKIIQEGFIYGMIVYGLPAGLLLWLCGNIVMLLKHDQHAAVDSTRRGSETRAAHLTVCVFLFFFLCATLSASIRLFMIVAGEPVETLYWLVDLSNLLMNMFALVTPILCYIFTRGFKDLFFVIRRPAKKGFFGNGADDHRLNNLLLEDPRPMPQLFEHSQFSKGGSLYRAYTAIEI